MAGKKIRLEERYGGKKDIAGRREKDMREERYGANAAEGSPAKSNTLRFYASG